MEIYEYSTKTQIFSSSRIERQKRELQSGKSPRPQ